MRVLGRKMRWRTIAYGLGVAATAVLADAEMQAWIGAHIPEVGTMVGTGIVVLRALTSSPLLSKEN